MRGDIDPGDHCFCPRVVGTLEVWKDFSSGNDTLSSPVATEPQRCPERQLSPRAGAMSFSQFANNQSGWGFHTSRGGIDPGHLHFRPQVVGIAEIGRDLLRGDGILSPPGTAGSRRWPEGQLSPRAGSISLSQLANSQVGWGIHTLPGGIDTGDHRFRPQVV